jgi:MFS family permease
VLSIPSMWPIVLSGALHNFNMTAISAFIGSFLIRYHHVDVARAGSYAMFVYGLSGVPALLLGGRLADRLTRRGPGARMTLASATFFLAAPLTYFGVDAAQGSPLAFAVPMGLGVACMYVYYAATYSTIQELVEPSMRGTAMAIYFCAMYLLGAAIGPVVVGRLSDHFTLAAATAANVRDTAGPALEPFKGAGLRRALYLVPAMNLALGVCMLVARRTVPRDVERLREWMRDAATAK